jgi:hypothetical protein
MKDSPVRGKSELEQARTLVGKEKVDDGKE